MSLHALIEPPKPAKSAQKCGPTVVQPGTSVFANALEILRKSQESKTQKFFADLVRINDDAELAAKFAEVLLSPSLYPRVNVSYALKPCDCSSVIDELIARADDEDKQYLGMLFLTKLDNVPENALSLVLPLLERPHSNTSELAAVVAGKIKSSKATNGLLKLLQLPNAKEEKKGHLLWIMHKSEFTSAVNSLKQIGDKSAIGPLWKALENPIVKSECGLDILQALAALGDEKAVSHLLPYLEESIVHPDTLSTLNCLREVLNDSIIGSVMDYYRENLYLARYRGTFMKTEINESLRFNVMYLLEASQSDKAVRAFISCLLQPDSEDVLCEQFKLFMKEEFPELFRVLNQKALDGIISLPQLSIIVEKLQPLLPNHDGAIDASKPPEMPNLNAIRASSLVLKPFIKGALGG